jgi:hypothetical protein
MSKHNGSQTYLNENISSYREAEFNAGNKPG